MPHVPARRRWRPVANRHVSTAAGVAGGEASEGSELTALSPGSVALVRSALAPVLSEARVSAAMTSQAIHGHALLVLQQEGLWSRVRGLDRYEGWIHGGYLGPSGHDAAGDAAALRQDSHPAALPLLGEHVRLSLGGVAGEGGLPLRAVVRDAGVTAVSLLDERERETRFPNTRSAVARTAETLFAGVSYLWGGVTTWGADCSGFVQAIYALHGLALPRDAWQQAAEGEAVSGGLARAEPGDLCFFSDRDDRRITHVGCMVDACLMSHVALGRGGFALDRVDGAGDDYARQLASRLLMVRRPTLP